MSRDILVAAENWSAAAHVGMIHNNHPTKLHLEEVVAKLIDIETAGSRRPYDDTVAAAWLHDTLRYTNTTPEEIGKTLSRRTARLVELTTDPGSKGVARTLEERQISKAMAHAQFIAEPDMNVRAEAGLIRCVDRFCNQRSALATRHLRKAEVYRDEFSTFMSVYGITLIDARFAHRQTLWAQLFVQHDFIVEMCGAA